ncbi:MAG: hypothetical protein ABFD66_03510 [Smithella sp.]
MEEMPFSVNKDTVHKLESLLENDYKDFEFCVSNSFETLKIKSITNPSLPILVIGSYFGQ